MMRARAEHQRTVVTEVSRTVRCGTFGPDHQIDG